MQRGGGGGGASFVALGPVSAFDPVAVAAAAAAADDEPKRSRIQLPFEVDAELTHGDVSVPNITPEELAERFRITSRSIRESVHRDGISVS